MQVDPENSPKGCKVGVTQLMLESREVEGFGKNAVQIFEVKRTPCQTLAEIKYVGLEAAKLDVLKKLNTLDPLQMGNGLYVLKKAIAQNGKAVRLLMGCGATLVDIQELSAKSLYELLSQLSMVISLVNKSRLISFSELLALNPMIRSELISQAPNVISLVKESRLISLEQLFALSPFVRAELIAEASGIIALVQEANLISFEKLLALDLAVRMEIIVEARRVIVLVNEMNLISFEKLLALDSVVRTQLITEIFKIMALVKEAKTISLTDLLTLDSDVRTELITNAGKVVALLRQGQASFEQLSSLSISDLRIIIADPTSEAAEEILNQSSSMYRIC